MALFDVDFGEDFLSDLLQSDFTEIATESLKEAAPVMVNAMKKSVKNTLDHEGDSELAESIKNSNPKKSSTGVYILNVGPSGNSTRQFYYKKREKGGHYTRKIPVSNVVKAIWKEYGIAGKQPAKPFIQSAVNDVKADVEEIIQKKFNEKTGGGL